MELILIPGIFLAFFLSLLVFSKQSKAVSDYCLGALFMVYGITILLGLAEALNRTYGYPWPGLISTSAPLIFLHGPLLWFYIKSLTVRQFRFRPVYLLHFVPFIIVLILFSINVYSLPAEQRILSEISMDFQEEFFYPFVIAGIALSTQGYNVWGLILIRNFNRRIKTYFSSIGEIDLKWLRFLLIAAILIYAANSLLYGLNHFFELLPYGSMQISAYAIASFYVVVLGFYGLRQGNLFVTTNVALDLEKASEQPQSPTTLEKREEEFIHHLLDHMKNKKPYLDADLNLAALASETGVSPEFLSGILNGHLNRNFFDFINSYRVEEFKTQVRNPANDKLSIIGIAWDCGFNSKATFNRVFRKATGLTPGEYRKQAF
ncbi:MAG: helix-turn-helix domain-containing protein [Bacteroidales bacterium]